MDELDLTDCFKPILTDKRGDTKWYTYSKKIPDLMYVGGIKKLEEELVKAQNIRYESTIINYLLKSNQQVGTTTRPLTGLLISKAFDKISCNDQVMYLIISPDGLKRLTNKSDFSIDPINNSSRLFRGAYIIHSNVISKGMAILCTEDSLKRLIYRDIGVYISRLDNNEQFNLTVDTCYGLSELKNSKIVKILYYSEEDKYE